MTLVHLVCGWKKQQDNNIICERAGSAALSSANIVVDVKEEPTKDGEKEKEKETTDLAFTYCDPHRRRRAEEIEWHDNVDPAMFGIELITSDSATPSLPQPESPRTLEDEFKDLLRSTGVKKGVETITDIYFAGDDIWNAQWLHHVLSHSAKGFVTEAQCKLIMASWTIKTGIPYRHEDFFED